ncbi:MAG: hypothetical protein SH857_09480 [Chitinophagales bacterium]|nr:hypothetical protein [Chitinophagales bacterium]
MKNTTQQETDLFEINAKRLDEIDKRLKQLHEKGEFLEENKREIEDLINERRKIHKWFQDTE